MSEQHVHHFGPNHEPAVAYNHTTSVPSFCEKKRFLIEVSMSQTSPARYSISDLQSAAARLSACSAGWLVLASPLISAGTVFFSYTNQPAVLPHEPATNKPAQPNRLLIGVVDSFPRCLPPRDALPW